MDTRKIILYEKYFDFARDMTDEQFGRVIRGLGSCFINNDESFFERFSEQEKILYQVMKYEIKINFEKYDEICEKRRKAGKKRWEEKQPVEQMHANAGNNNNINKNINNNINNNNNKNTNKNYNKNKNTGAYNFEEIENLAIKRRMGYKA